MRVVSIDSAGVNCGNTVGIRLAKIVLPETDYISG
jgi:hypothetical protein